MDELGKKVLFYIIVIVVVLILLFAIIIIYNENEEQPSGRTYVNTTTFTNIIEKVTNTTTTTQVPTTTVVTTPVVQTKDYSKYPTFNQYPEYPTGCETVALYLLLKYYKVDVTIDELIDNLKKQPIRQVNAQGEACVTNPNEYFLGDPRSDVGARGVYNEPIKELANKYKKGAISKSGISFNEIEKVVKSGKPAVVWTTISLRESNRVIIGNDCNTGEPIMWQTNEHALLVIDVTDDNVVVSDPTTGSIQYYDKEIFIDRFNIQGSRTVYYK